MQRGREETAIVGVGMLIASAALFDAVSRDVGIGQTFSNPAAAGGFNAALAGCGAALLYQAARGHQLSFSAFGLLIMPFLSFLAYYGYYSWRMSSSLVGAALMLIPFAFVLLAMRWREKPPQGGP